MNFKLPVKLYIIYTKGFSFFMVKSVFKLPLSRNKFSFLFLDMLICSLKSVPVALNLHYEAAVIAHYIG